MPFGLPKDLKGATTYKHTVALASFVEINKQINAKFIPSPDNNSATYKIINNVNQMQSRNVGNKRAFYTCATREHKNNRAYDHIFFLLDVAIKICLAYFL
jgi:hypothetical protein